MTSPTTSTRALASRSRAMTGKGGNTCVGAATGRAPLSLISGVRIGCGLEWDIGTPDCVVIDAELGHRLRFIKVAPIEDHGRLQHRLHVHEIGTLEFLPFGQHDERIGPGQRFLLRSLERQPGMLVAAIGEIEREYAARL